MNGYFISKEKAEQLGLLDNPYVASNLQKTIVVITQNDISEYQQDVRADENKINEMANWFYKNYYENLMETLASFKK